MSGPSSRKRLRVALADQTFLARRRKMQSNANSQVAGMSSRWTLGPARDQVRRLCARIVQLIDARADAYAAAALYEKLSKLSNAELERRGLPRGELHRCVFETFTKQ
jgi:hypothetical protein